MEKDSKYPKPVSVEITSLEELCLDTTKVGSNTRLAGYGMLYPLVNWAMVASEPTPSTGRN